MEVSQAILPNSRGDGPSSGPVGCLEALCGSVGVPQAHHIALGAYVRQPNPSSRASFLPVRMFSQEVKNRCEIRLLFPISEDAEASLTKRNNDLTGTYYPVPLLALLYAQFPCLVMLRLC